MLQQVVLPPNCVPLTAWIP